MKSTEFVTEAQVRPYKYADMGVEQAVATLNQHCSESMGMINHPLWRGMRNHDAPVFLVDPSTGKRESNNTSNYYTELMDNSPYFAGWPKRSASYICSTGRRYASGYGWGGSLYTLFPFNGVKIAMCPQQDIWETQINSSELGMYFGGSCALDDFNGYLAESLRLPPKFKSMAKLIMSPKWQKSMINFEDDWADPPSDEIRNLLKQPNGGQKLLDLLLLAMSPARTGFKLLSIQEYIAAKAGNKECWVGGPMVAIREDVYDKFVSAIKNKDPVAQTNVAPAVLPGNKK